MAFNHRFGLAASSSSLHILLLSSPFKVDGFSLLDLCSISARSEQLDLRCEDVSEDYGLDLSPLDPEQRPVASEHLFAEYTEDAFVKSCEGQPHSQVFFELYITVLWMPVTLSKDEAETIY